MLEKEYKYLNTTISQYIFNNKRYYYPSCNTKIEFTNVKECIKYIKSFQKAKKMMYVDLGLEHLLDNNIEILKIINKQ